jgi:hypothetical protein
MSEWVAAMMPLARRESSVRAGKPENRLWIMYP